MVIFIPECVRGEGPKFRPGVRTLQIENRVRSTSYGNFPTIELRCTVAQEEGDQSRAPLPG